MKYRSPLSIALGMGSAKHGFSHWWWQRLSAVALIPLTIWFVYSIVSLVGAEYQVIVEWIAEPVQATLLLLFVLTSLFHAQTGLQVVIEDYVHTKWMNLLLLLIVKFSSVVMAVITIISVLKIVLRG